MISEAPSGNAGGEISMCTKKNKPCFHDYVTQSKILILNKISRATFKAASRAKASGSFIFITAYLND